MNAVRVVRKKNPGKIRVRRKQQLIDAAILSLDKHGISNTTTETISKIAGLSKGAIHHHFDSKEDLLLNTVKYLINEISSNVRETLRSDAEPLEKVKKILFDLMVPKSLEKHEFKAWMFFWMESMNHQKLARILNIYQRRLESNLMHELNKVYARETSRYLADIFHRAANGFWLEICLSPEPDFQGELEKASRFFGDLVGLHSLLQKQRETLASVKQTGSVNPKNLSKQP